MIDPITTIDTGGFGVVGNTTHHAALGYSISPDDDYVQRDEPNSGVLTLGFPSLSPGDYTLYTRARILPLTVDTIPLTIEVKDGSTVKATDVFVVGTNWSTHTLAFSGGFTTTRVSYYTSGFVPSEKYYFAWLQLSMSVIGDETSGEPPIRTFHLTPTFGYRYPCYEMTVITNTADPISVPVGFKVIAVSHNILWDGTNYIPLIEASGTGQYTLWLRPIP